MQTIFLELDRQIGLEQQLAQQLATDPNALKAIKDVFLASQSSQIWAALFKTSNAEREHFLNTVIPKEKGKWSEQLKASAQDSVL